MKYPAAGKKSERGGINPGLRCPYLALNDVSFVHLPQSRQQIWTKKLWYKSFGRSDMRGTTVSLGEMLRFIVSISSCTGYCQYTCPWLSS